MTKAARKVLIIEDNTLQYRVTRQHLEKTRDGAFVVDWSSTFDDGLQRLSAGGYDVCLLDYQLGERDGLELLREARARECRTPVIFLTADASLEVDVAAMEAGAADYLVKGEISTRLLERSIRYALKLAATLEELRRLATRDELTGLLNRRELERILAEEIERAARFGRTSALVLLDLDHFKKVNDTHGHPAGDAVLRETARRLQTTVRSVDRVARFGGEEIAVVLLEVDGSAALAMAERLVQALRAEPVTVEPGLDIKVTASAGVALLPRHADTVPGLIAAADRALYAAKHAGRDRVIAVE